MIRITIFVEGQTEETFVRDLLVPHFSPMLIFFYPILVRTSATGRGGVVSYAKIKPQLHRKCLEDQSAYVTTMFDLFRLPTDFPGMSDSAALTDPLERARLIEAKMQTDVGQSNFIPNLTVHEFEGLLYSDTGRFADWFPAATVKKLQRERLAAESPEHINDGPNTAPSKRIKKACPGYDKPLHGSLIAYSIGLERIRTECRHFDAWLTVLSLLPQGGHL